MKRLSCFVPKGDIGVAFSGGPDSVYAAQYYMRDRSRRVTLFHVNHGTEHSRETEHFVRNWCCMKDCDLVVHKIDGSKPKDESWEEYWRNQRYRFFHSQDLPIVTGHHLEDSVETYLFSAFHGRPHVMPNTYKNVLRPFLYLRRSDMEPYVKRSFQDPSNQDLRYARNRIRHIILPEIEKVHPGIYTTVRKLMEKEFEHK